jgi:lipopolysaccharide transport system ATP-binding protein
MEQNIENREVAIKLSDVKKMYKLGQIGGGTLQADLQSWWARKRGKEDPNTKIGQEERLVGQTFMALNGIDLTVYKGEALGIIGGNGAGKSTMLKLLSRVTAPTEGKIDLYGRVASMLEVGTGFNGEMTGRENVYMNGAILGMTKAEIDEKMEDIIEFSEVRDFIDTPVKRYSSGMYVKLAFSVAAHLDSEIMIMDEVLAVGDMAFQKKCLNKMREAANKEGRTVLYVSHNMNTIRQLCDRCVVLDKGKIIYDGDVENAIQIYMSNSKASDDSEIELEELHRPKYITSQARMLHLSFLDKDKNIYYADEKIQFKLKWRCNCNLNDVKLRTLVVSAEGVPVGLAGSDSMGNFVSGEYMNTMEFNFRGLVPGKYYLTMTLYQNDSVGNSLLVDTLEQFSSFEIVDNPNEENKLQWATKYWGNIRFPDTSVL